MHKDNGLQPQHDVFLFCRRTGNTSAGLVVCRKCNDRYYTQLVKFCWVQVSELQHAEDYFCPIRINAHRYDSTWSSSGANPHAYWKEYALRWMAHNNTIRADRAAYRELVQAHIVALDEESDAGMSDPVGEEWEYDYQPPLELRATMCCLCGESFHKHVLPLLPNGFGYVDCDCAELQGYDHHGEESSWFADCICYTKEGNWSGHPVHYRLP